MALADGAHFILGGVRGRVDENAPEEIGRPAYEHRGETLFRRGLDITGRPGAQNLREERLIWHQTDWAGGEGQVVLDGSDPATKKFYRSEGLDARVPGQLKLNKSTTINSPIDSSGGASNTKQGTAFSDITGTATTVNTNDKRLNVVGDIIESSVYTPGAAQVAAEFSLYKEAVQETQILGSALQQYDGGGQVNGVNFELRKVGSACQTVVQNGLGTDPYTYTATCSISGGETNERALIKVLVVDTTRDRDDVIASTTKVITSLTEVPVTFTPRTSHTYRVRVRWILERPPSKSARIEVSSIDHGKADLPTDVTISVRNNTAGTTILTKDLTINSTTTSPFTVVYDAAAATDYAYRVTYVAGNQRPVVDKLVSTVNTTTPWSFETIDLGTDGLVWLTGHRSGTNIHTWTYDFGSEDWTEGVILDSVTTSGEAVRATAFTSAYAYFLVAGGEVIQATVSADDNYTAAHTDATGMCIAQDRLFVLTEDDSGTNGVQIRTYAVDADVSGGATAAIQTVTVTSATIAADTTLRQRMCGTPGGARFFVNLWDGDATIYESDASGSTTTVRPIAKLETGVKATAITHVGGLTFITGQFMAEEGQVPRSALWVINQNGELRRIGYFRRDDPTDAAPVAMQSYQNDLWIQQGKYVWRYGLSASSGGLFLEYELNPTTESYQRGIAVLQGHQFSLFSQESSTNTGGAVWVTGSVATYRQATVTDGNTLTSSVYDYGLPGENKLLRHVQVVTDDLPADTAVSVELQYDEDGTWIPIGSHTTGPEKFIRIANADASVPFKTLRTRTTLSSQTGVSTPTLKAVIPEAFAMSQEEFFTLMVRTEDEDSTDHVASQTWSAGDTALAIWGMWRQGLPVTFVDGFAHSNLDINPSYLVKIEDPQQSSDDNAEGRMSVKLRVLDG